MPDPEVSDRERLLRLIDGGPEVVRELQKQREVPPPPPPLPPAAKQQDGPVPPKGRAGVLFLSEAHKVRVAQSVLAAIVVAFAVYSMSNALKSEPGAATFAEADPSQAPRGGLRLVGVDWGERPVALLEDMMTGKTYFVRQNDTVRGLRVKEIQKDRVLVFGQGKSLELR